MGLDLIGIPHDILDIGFFQVGAGDWNQPGLGKPASWTHEKTVPYGIIAQVQAGEYEITCNRQTVRIKAPGAFLTPAHHPMRIIHRVDRRRRFVARWIHFSFVLYQSIDFTSLLDMPLQIDSRHARQLGRMMQDLNLLKNTDPLAALKQSVHRHELMWRVLRIVCDISEFKADAADRLRAGSRLAPLLAHLKNNLARPISAAKMARLANMSESRFFAFFQSKMECSPMEYVKRIRLNEAAARLSLTDQPLKAVAAETGFANPFHLSREFKRRFGLSPKQYRALPA